MKLMSLIGGLAIAALLLAFPAAAAVSPAFDAFSPAQVVSDECPVIASGLEAKFFVEADQGCDMRVAHLTDACLVETTSMPPAVFAVIFVPVEATGCAISRPSPPG